MRIWKPRGLIKARLGSSQEKNLTGSVELPGRACQKCRSQLSDTKASQKTKFKIGIIFVQQRVLRGAIPLYD